MEGLIPIQLGEATLRIALACGAEQDSARDLTSLGTWSFRVEDLRQVVPADFRHYYAEVGGQRRSRPLWDEIDDGIDDADPWVEVRDADSGIMILALLGSAGGEYELRYDSRGSSFWAFHDLSHVRRDAWLEAGGGGLHPVDAGGEDRAHTEGALEALETGAITLAEVARALVTSEAAFLQRFGAPSRALDAVVEHFDRRG